MSDHDPRRAWVSRLRPQGEVDLEQVVIPRPIVQDAVARVGADPVRWAMELNSLVVRRIVDTVPALGGSPAAVEMLRRGNGATTLQALFALVKGSAVASPAREATLAGIREFVHRGIPLEDILRGVRIGHAATAEAFLQACAELVEPGVAVEEVKAVSGELFTYVDELSDSMISTYLVEHEVWTTSVAAARADVVRSLLLDAATVDVAGASRTLGYDLTRTHQAVTVWSDSPDSGANLQATVRKALHARGATTTLVVPVAAGRLWAWGTVPTSGAPPTGSWETVSQMLAQQGMQAAFGTPVDGLAGFRQSHREAERGERLERLRRKAGRDPRCATAFADVAVIALLATDLDAAGTFVRRELGALAVISAPMEALRTTLYHYLEAERSLVDVAGRLFVAKGTVTYRVKRAQALLGHDLDDRRFTLHIALALAEELGDAVLLPRDVQPELRGGARPGLVRQINGAPGS